jgi:hypothetical protein
MPEVFPVVHAIVTRASLPSGRRVRPAHKALEKAAAALARLQGLAPATQDGPEAKAEVEARRAEGQRWTQGHTTSRQPLETLSRTRHPFGLTHAAPPTSAQVARPWHAGVEAREALPERPQGPARHDARNKVRTQVPALAARVDVWWQGVQQEVDPLVLSPLWRRWVDDCLLPLGSWEHHAARTRCARRHAKMRQALEAVQGAVHTHALTQQLAPRVLEAWQAWATQRTKALQRPSSAVEGRNGSLAPRPHQHRGLPRRRDKVWTVFHTFDGRAADGTTPASRCFRRSLQDLFETVVSHIDAFPRSRQRQRAVGLSP